MNKYLLLALALAGMSNLHAQSPAGLLWQRAFGGTRIDAGNVTAPTSDGGCIVGGYSCSDVSGTKTSVNYGMADFWAVKLDASGNKQWDRSCGGTNADRINSLQQTSDGGYILAGSSFSTPSGSKTSLNHGDGDYWIVKLDANGNQQWDRSFGGLSNDVLRVVLQTSEGGYLLAGSSASGLSGVKSSANLGLVDYWMVKLNSAGNKQWEKTYGGTQDDELASVQPTSDGGYILGGTSFSGASGNKTTANSGLSDYWIVKVDAAGNKQWEKSLGGEDADELRALQQTTDGGYVLGGSSYSAISGNKTSGTFGSHDYWVVKLDAAGAKQWERTWGGVDADELHSVHGSPDGGYMLGGISSSRISGNKGTTNSAADPVDYWIVKIDASGTRQWEQCIPGSYSGEILRLQASGNGGYLLASDAHLPSGEVDYRVSKWAGPLSLTMSFGLHRMYQAQLTGLPGTQYVLEASPDFRAWTALKTNQAPTGAITFVGTNAAGMSQRFYRARQL